MMSLNERDNTIKIRTCRICLDAKSVDMVLIEEQNGWLQLFEFCFGFTLTIQDEPRLLCKLCADNVQSYVRFKEKCQKSHSLWKSVISDVTYCVVKHENVENTNDNVNDPVTCKTEIKDETLDPLFDNDIHFSNDDDIEMDNFSPAEIKTEISENDTKSKGEESNNEEEDCVVKNKVKSEHKKSKKNYSNGIVKSKKKNIYTCVKCKDSYERKVWYLKHIKVCKSKRKRRIFDQDYAYDLGRKYDGQNIDKAKHEPRSEVEINQNRNDFSFSCGLCNLSFTTTKDLCIHLNDHWSNNDLSCTFCDFVGIDLAAIVAHRYSHLSRNKLRFYCHICEKFKCSLLALHFHYRREHLRKSAGGYCSRCNKEYNKLRRWKKHEMTHCTPKYICDFCGKGYYYKHAIQEHVINHMRLKRSVCDVCGKSFTRQRNMKLHKDTVHTKSGPLECTHCNRLFKNKHTLSNHKKAVTREKTLQCEVCHKTFITPNVLKLHMVFHSDKRPYHCDLCGTSYKYKSQLTIHLLKHNGTLPQCSICMKTFASPMSLKRHSSVHTGVRQYNCSVTNCIRTFHSKNLMLAHLKLRHKNENVGEN